MTDVTLEFETVIDAPVHAVFEYCRDPRRIYGGDPTHEVTSASITPGGVGTTAQVLARTAVYTEDIAIQYVEVTPDDRIVFDARPRMSFRGLGRFVIPGARHTWTWTFVPEGDGTRMSAVVVEHDAPWWERTLDTLTRHAGTRMFSQEVTDRLRRIKRAVEKQAAASA